MTSAVPTRARFTACGGHPSVTRARRVKSVVANAQVVRPVIRQATGTAQLRALAYLRSSCFYTCQEGCSEFAQRAFWRMKADAQWQSIEDKVHGREVGWHNTQVIPLVATVSKDTVGDLCAKVQANLADLSPLIPAQGGMPAQMVLGTLDVNIGPTLPAEELVGCLPEAEANTQRAYLSNVCVAEGARGLGIARDLIAEATRMARELGVLHVYVHVVEDNTAAQQLYASSGFTVEAEESADMARKRQHGRRFLLWRPVLAEQRALQD